MTNDHLRLTRISVTASEILKIEKRRPHLARKFEIGRPYDRESLDITPILIQ